MAVTSDQQQVILQRLGEQNPEFAAAPPEVQRAYIDAVTTGTPQQRAAKMQALHQQYPQYIKNESLWKNKAFLIGLGALSLGVGSALVAGGAGAAGAAGAGGGGSTLGAVGPLAADEVFTAGPIAGTGLAGVDLAGMGATGGGGSLLHSLLPTIIGAGSQIGGAAMAAHGQSEAAKISAEAADKALKVRQEQYALQRQDTAPARALALGAIGNLGYLSGIDYQKDIPALSSTVPSMPYGTTPGGPSSASPTLSNLGHSQPAGSPDVGQAVPRGGLVSVRNSQTGIVHLIPSDQVPAALQDGGVRV